MPKFPLSLALFALLLVAPVITQAQEQFDPQNLIDDVAFEANQQMDAGAIQRFLVTHGSGLASLTPSQLGEGAGGRNAAQIIYEATRGTRTDFGHADAFGAQHPLNVQINPEVILITLQKEEALITNQHPSASALNSAMGYGCIDGVACNRIYSGFTNQVVYAAAQLSKNFILAASSKYPPGKTAIVQNALGGPDHPVLIQRLTITNAATSALYQYTPHVYYGNKNFFYYRMLWFSQVSEFPVGGYLAHANNSPTYYVIGGVKRRVKGPEEYSLLNLQSTDIQNIPAGALHLMIEGPAVGLPSQATGSQLLYLVKSGRKWRFYNRTSLMDWGFSTADIDTVDPGLLQAVPDGGDIRLLR